MEMFPFDRRVKSKILHDKQNHAAVYYYNAYCRRHLKKSCTNDFGQFSKVMRHMFRTQLSHKFSDLSNLRARATVTAKANYAFMYTVHVHRNVYIPFKYSQLLTAKNTIRMLTIPIKLTRNVARVVLGNFKKFRHAENIRFLRKLNLSACINRDKIQVSRYRLRTFFRYSYCETLKRVISFFTSTIFIARVLPCN